MSLNAPVLSFGTSRVNKTPSKWLAAVLSVFTQPLGLLIVGVVLVVAVVLFARSFVVEIHYVSAGSMLPTYKRGHFLWTQKWGYGNYGTFGVSLMHRPITAPLARGDVVVFEYPLDRSGHYLKRLVGLPGDEVSYRHHVLSINRVEAQVKRSGEYVEPGNQFVEPGTRFVHQRFIESLSGHEYAVIFDPQSRWPLPQDERFVRRDQCTFHDDGLTCRLPDGYYFVLGDNRDNSLDSRTFGLVPADHLVGKVIDLER